MVLINTYIVIDLIISNNTVVQLLRILKLNIWHKN